MGKDPRDTAVNVLTIAALALILFLATSIVLVGATGGRAGASDPPRAVCEARAEHLPDRIPVVLLLNVTDEDGKRLSGDLASSVRADLERAVLHLGLPRAIVVAMEDDDRASDAAGSHVAQVEIWRDRILTPEGDDGASEAAEGMMCGNTIIAQHHGVAVFDGWTLAHELGHYLGLPHHDRTLMNDEANRAPRFDTLSACQRAILASWTPGASYVPHWERGERGECADQRSGWVSALETLRYHVTGT